MNRATPFFYSLLILVAVGSVDATAQIPPTTQASTTLASPTTSEMRSQILNLDDQGAYSVVAGENGRSVPLAFGLSAVLPGAGQYYNKQYVKSGVVLAIEAAVITGYSILRTRGLNGESDFRNVAHQNWSPVKYATWLNDYSDYLVTELGAVITAPPIQLINSVDFKNPGGWSTSDQAAVNSLFSQIRAIERQVYHPETGAAFSHQIPDFSAQQYYELIGKYFQFAPGWDDYGAWKDSQGRFTAAIDPEMTGTNETKPNVSTSFYAYAKDHAHAQDLLREASRISLLFVFNHLMAAIDAAVSAKLYNDKLETQMGLAYNNFGPPTPVASIRLRF